ncbi:MAG: hypothetical protein QUS14_14845 [Pyrinomonadaceae bacterium]|nr:hypothetical protein [Pyrinomonadaceae bacterium]
MLLANYARFWAFNSLIRIAFLLVLVAAGDLFGQELPHKIRGYRVHKEAIVLTPANSDEKQKSPAVSAGEPSVKDVELSGVSFEIPLEFTAPEQSGKVDFITIHDLRVNGIPVDVEEYRLPFTFKKNEAVVLPAPLTVFVPTPRVLQAAWSELRASKAEWKITGRVLVFGKFRRFGFYHKRVVPVDLAILIPNPLR